MRLVQTLPFLAGLMLIGGGAVASAGSAAARPAGPYIGCDSLHPYARQARWITAPTGSCETGGSLGTMEGIAGARWSGWGTAHPTATGFLVDGLGYRYPAQITAGGLRRRGGVASYGTLRVVAQAERRGGVMRGPYRVRIDVRPDTQTGPPGR